MANSKLLNDAKKRKDDEYFTLYEDIANEIPLYKEQLRGKRIICPCDWDECFETALVYKEEGYYSPETLFSTGETIKRIDVAQSKEKMERSLDSVKCNFVKFLVAHADDYGIKSISVSGYDPDRGKGIKFQHIDYSNYDIAITNPPFSSSNFIDFVETMMENNMKFLVIGPQTAIGYKNTFKYIQNNQMWLGYAKELIGFARPDGSLLLSKNPEGSVPRACKWFTNLDVSYRHDKLILTEKYEEGKYPRYDNYDGIDVKETKSIPYDYEGAMGVPITFIQKYNPDQFEILGVGSGNLAKELGIKKNYRGRTDLAFTNEKGQSKCPFGRIVIRNREVYHDED